jgi:dihydrofolate reductase
MNAPELHVIAAVARNGVIGRGGQLPWHLPDDLKAFKQLTMGHPIIMGRRTFESIGKALPGRRSIVVSTQLSHPPCEGVEIARSLDQAIEIAAKDPGPAFVIGGAALYAAALERASGLHLTEVDADVEGDTFFPPFDRSQWRLLVKHLQHPKDERHALKFTFCTYRRA